MISSFVLLDRCALGLSSRPLRGQQHCKSASEQAADRKRKGPLSLLIKERKLEAHTDVRARKQTAEQEAHHNSLDSGWSWSWWN
jgi:hypothetical protein